MGRAKHPRSKVAVIKVDPDATADALYTHIAKAAEALGDLFRKCPQKGTVLLKPNFGVPAKNYCVNLPVVHAVARLLKDRGYKTIIGEDPSATSKSQYNRWKRIIDDFIGMKTFAESIGAEWADLRNGNHRTVKVENPLYFKELEISDYALDADFIVSLAKMKVVNVCAVSLSMKNLKGVMRPEWKHKFHCDGLSQGIVDLNKTLKPHIAIIDATYAQDQVARKHFPVGLLIISNDYVAADTVCTRIMGLNPETIEHIVLAEKAGLGTANIDDIEIIGEKLENLVGKYKFSTPLNPLEYADKSGGAIEIIQGHPCSACLNELGNELKFFKNRPGVLKNLTILVGPDAAVPETDRRIILYGNCLKKHADKGDFIHGCPPTNYLEAGTGSLRMLFRSS